MQNEIIEAALSYAHMGLAVIPLNGKIPIFQNWPDVATTDEKTIAKWFQQRPDANLGIATGKKSGVFVVDIDPRHGGDKSWQMEVESHPGEIETWEDLTGGGGRHIWFRYPAFEVRNHAGIFPGVDIRGDGGQVVAPPSIHPVTKMPYEWDGFVPIQQQRISDAPLWLLDILEPKAGPRKERVIVPQLIPHGVQHHVLLSLAGVMRRMGLDAEAMLPTLMYVHEHNCEKPGPRKNIEDMAHRVMKYPPDSKEIFNIATKLWRMCAAKEHEQAEKEARFHSVDGYTLMMNPPPDIREVIENCLHIGCTLLAGSPKSGKSWAALAMAISVATGGKFLSARDVKRPGRVGYYALEESEGRTSKRLRMLVEAPDIALQNIDFIYELKPMYGGGLEELELYCKRFKPDLLVIDTLMAFVSSNPGTNGNVFKNEYRELKAIRDLAVRNDVAILVVHHTNKSGLEGLGKVAGSGGITAAPDSIWILTRQPQKRAVLTIVGREVEDQELLLEFNLEHYVGWAIIQEGDDVAFAGEKQCILEVLRNFGIRTPLQLSREIGKPIMQTRQLLRTMQTANLIVEEQNGSYRLPGSGRNDWTKETDDEN